MEQEFNQQEIDYPWLLFRLGNNSYALSSRRVTGIQPMPASVEKMPDSPDCVRGIFSLRGAIVPLLDLRRELNIKTLSDEYEDFVAMISQRQQDHINWAKELKRCLESGEKFNLATDPHICAFGKWFDSFETDVDSLNHILRKIEEPHRKLHEAALGVDTCKQDHDTCEREVCLKDIMLQLEEKYVPTILSLLDEMKEAFYNTFREMVIVLDFDGKQVGVIVDEVLAVEHLSMDETDDTNMKKFAEQRFVTGVAKSETTGGVVLIMDEARLCGSYCVVY